MANIVAKDFLERIGKEKQPAVLLEGSDLFWRDLCREKLVETYVPEGARDWAVARFSLVEDSLDPILQQAQTVPMMAPRQVIFVGDLEALEKKSEATRDAAIEQLTSYFADPAPFTLLVFEASKLDNRMKLGKLFADKALVVDLHVPGSSPGIVLELARRLGVRIDRDALTLLDELLGGNLARVRIELEKLATYVGERRQITAADVSALVLSAKSYSVWQLAELLATGDRTRALNFLETVLRDGEPAPAVVGALAWMFRKLLEAQELSPGASQYEAARLLNMRPETAAVALQQARRISKEKLRVGLALLAEADNRLKLGYGIDSTVMDFLVSELTARPNVPAPLPRPVTR